MYFQILEHAVRQTNGKVIPVHEVNRLINMTRVMVSIVIGFFLNSI